GQPEGLRERGHGGDLERGGGAHPFPLGYLRVGEQAEAPIRGARRWAAEARAELHYSEHVRRTARSGRTREIRESRGGAELPGGERVDLHGEGSGSVRPQRGDLDLATRTLLEGCEARLGQRHLEHQRAAVIGDAAHDVQSSG